MAISLKPPWRRSSDPAQPRNGAPRVNGRRRVGRIDGGGSNGADPPRPPTTLPSAQPGPEAPRRRPRLKKLRFAFVFLGLAILALVSWIFGIMMAVANDLPQLEDRAQFENAQNSVVYDSHGKRIATLTNNQGRVLIESNEIAPVMKEAAVSIEDQRFYEHRGIDFQGIGRALLEDVLHRGATQGASTITQQFVKNALRAQGSRTVFEKLREAALAYQLERHWDKDKILTEYLNEIYFGEGAYGIEAAARTYFGWDHPGCGDPGDRCASDLFPWEAAMLAGLISNPTGYDPKTNAEAATGRRNVVLQNMADQGYITQDEAQQYAQENPPAPSDIRTPEENSKAPYFTSWLRQQLVDKYGAGEAFGGGLNITSTLDLSLQSQVQQIADERTLPVGLNSAVVVLNNTNGGVEAMIGGNDYKQAPFNLATQGHRQPGSAFKPFTLVTALEQGHSPDQVFTSAPQQIPYKAKIRKKGGGDKVVDDVFRVNNYGDEYLGSASIATATTYSDNSVFSQLGTQVGPANVAHTAYSMGIQTNLGTPNIQYSVNDQPFSQYNPALILGGLQEGVTPLEMAHAYQTLQHNGQIVSGSMADSSDGPVGIQAVTDNPPENGQPSGHAIETNNGDPGFDKPEYKQVVPPNVAATARTLLHSVVTSGTGRNAYTGDPNEWGKTGTTENNGDAWFVGAIKDVTVAVWVGHADSNKSMNTEYGGAPVDGGTIPALIFHDVITAYDQDKAGRKSSTGGTGIPTAPPTSTAPAPSAPTPSSPSPQPDQQQQQTPTGGPPPSNNTAPAPSGGGATAGGGVAG